MATTKKATTGKKPVAGARKGATKAKVVATKSKSTSKATAKSAPAPKAVPAPKKTVPVTLNDRQREVLQKVKDAGESGYSMAKGEQRTIDALAVRKLLKKGAKNKATGNTPYLLTKAAAKHLPAAAPAPASAPAVAAEPAPAPAPAPATASVAAPAPPPAM